MSDIIKWKESVTLQWEWQEREATIDELWEQWKDEENNIVKPLLLLAKDLRTRLEECEKMRRTMGCGYCGTEIYHYQGPMPPPQDELVKMIKLFEEHDRNCPQNPLRAELAATSKQLAETQYEALQRAIQFDKDIAYLQRKLEKVRIKCVDFHGYACARGDCVSCGEAIENIICKK